MAWQVTRIILHLLHGLLRAPSSRVVNHFKQENVLMEYFDKYKLVCLYICICIYISALFNYVEQR